MLTPASTPDWRGPGSNHARLMDRRTRLKRGLVAWRHERSRLTGPGALFVGITLALGTAAYNASNNLLFLALSLLLACLILNGVLAWVNFGGAAWRLRVPPRMRAWEPCPCAIEVANARRWTPLYALVFEVRPAGGKPGLWLPLRESVQPQSTARLPWTHVPEKRGRIRIDLGLVASRFPFGFLRKAVFAECGAEALVHPPRVRYEDLGLARRTSEAGLRASSTRGEGSDILTVRPYQVGDTPRSIHWKATARTGRLMVRDLARDEDGQLELRIDTSGELWTADSFEAMIAFAATLAEDLDRSGRLRSIRIDGRRHTISHPSDVQACLDLLAEISRSEQPAPPVPPPASPVLHLMPGVEGALTAILHGSPVAHLPPR